MLMNPQRFAHRSSDRNDGSISSRLTFPKLHLATLNAALFSFDPESLTLASPLEMSEANALSVATSLCSSGVVTTPLFSSCFLVLGLLTKLSRTAAFLAGEAGRVVFTLSVARFFYVLFGNAAPPPRISSTFLSCLRLSRYFRTLSLVCSLIKALLA